VPRERDPHARSSAKNKVEIADVILHLLRHNLPGKKKGKRWLGFSEELAAQGMSFTSSATHPFNGGHDEP
jgi:hypothetical protein